MSKNDRRDAVDVAETGRCRSMMALCSTSPPSSQGQHAGADRRTAGRCRAQPGVDRRGLVQLVAAAGQVADRSAPARRPARRRSRRRACCARRTAGRARRARSVWKISRVTTSKTIERRSGVRGCAGGEPAALGARPAAARGPARDRRRWRPAARPVRRRKIRLATPVAATTSTEISPMVSQARMSTSDHVDDVLAAAVVVRPARRRRAETGVGVRAPTATNGDTRRTATPTATRDARPRRQRRADGRSLEERAGSRRSTSTNTTSVTVSTQELGERQVGGAVQRRTARRAVAGHADQEHRGQPAARPDGEHARRPRSRRRRRPAAGLSQSRSPSGQGCPATARQRQAGHHDEQDDAEVDRQRAALGARR